VNGNGKKRSKKNKRRVAKGEPAGRETRPYLRALTRKEDPDSSKGKGRGTAAKNEPKPSSGRNAGPRSGQLVGGTKGNQREKVS